MNRNRETQKEAQSVVAELNVSHANPAPIINVKRDQKVTPVVGLGRGGGTDSTIGGTDPRLREGDGKVKTFKVLGTRSCKVPENTTVDISLGMSFDNVMSLLARCLPEARGFAASCLKEELKHDTTLDVIRKAFAGEVHQFILTAPALPQAATLPQAPTVKEAHKQEPIQPPQSQQGIHMDDASQQLTSPHTAPASSQNEARVPIAPPQRMRDGGIAPPQISSLSVTLKETSAVCRENVEVTITKDPPPKANTIDFLKPDFVDSIPYTDDPTQIRTTTVAEAPATPPAFVEFRTSVEMSLKRRQEQLNSIVKATVAAEAEKQVPQAAAVKRFLNIATGTDTFVLFVTDPASTSLQQIRDFLSRAKPTFLKAQYRLVVGQETLTDQNRSRLLTNGATIVVPTDPVGGR